MVVMEEMEPLDHRDHEDHRVLLVYKVHLVPGVLESPTLGGEGPPVKTHQELIWCMLEELEVVAMISMEVEQTTSVCLKIQSTLLDIQMELGTTTMCMEQSINTQ